MDADAVIESYVNDVAQQLPRKQRQDVAFELRALLHEELQARAASQGRLLDTEMTLEGLRAFGRPKDVAVRYHRAWTIIPPAETRNFVHAAIIGASVLIALGMPGEVTTRNEQLGILLFTWLGVLVSYFGVRSFIQHRKQEESQWVPHDRDRVSRTGSLLLIVLICIGIVVYGAPSWVLAHLTGGRSLSSWLTYDAQFRATRLPFLFALWGCQAVLLAALAMRGRWNLLLRRIDIGLSLGVAIVLMWFVRAGNIFEQSVPNRAAKGALGIFAVLILIDVAVKLYRGAANVAEPNELRRTA